MKKNILFLFGLCAVVLSTGCFTVLNHPDVIGKKNLKDPAREYVFESANHGTVCSSCHTGYSGFTLNNPYVPDDSYYSGASQKYIVYNQYPWWIDSYFDKEYSSEVSENPPERGSVYIPRNFSAPRGGSYGPAHVVSPFGPPSSAAGKENVKETSPTKPKRSVSRSGKTKAASSKKSDTSKEVKKRKAKKKVKN